MSAYRDGGMIIKKIKHRREQRRAPPPPRLLEESVAEAPEEIEKEKKRGVQRFGAAFAQGDHVAVIALQQITIQLQGTLLEKLRNATLDDEMVTDFTFLVDAADLGRDRTISAMLDLRQRLLQAAPINEIQAPAMNERQAQSRQPSGSKVPQTKSKELPTKPANEPAPLSKQQHRPQTQTRDNASSSEASAKDNAGAGADVEPSFRKRHSSLLGFFRHHRMNSGSNEQVPRASDPARKSSTSTPASVSVPFKPPPQCDASEQQPAQSAEMTETQFKYQPWEDDPAAIWAPERRDTVASLSVAPDMPAAPRASTTRQSLSGASSMVRTNTNRTASTAVPTPTPENEYLGFCKSAWKLQNGDRRGMDKRKEFHDGWVQSNYYFLACAHSRCAFAGRIPLDKIWDKVFRWDAKGIKLRWAFLAKSHIPQYKVKDRQFRFQCIFCVYLGEEKRQTFVGDNAYLRHVSDEHHDQTLGEVVLYKSGCIAHREADDSEEFDINFWPVNAGEQVDLNEAAGMFNERVSGYEESAHPGAGAHDSVFNEPWNEGLSDFHWGADFERSVHE